MAADHPIRLGLKLSPQNCTIDDLRGIWRLADESGFDHVWGFDHLNPIFSDHAGPIFEGMSLLAAMAEATSRVRIGLMVAGNTYRHPAVMAKMATTIDHLSGGRLEFGIGAAWADFEHTTLGIPFYTTGQRIRRLGEACTVFRKLWTEETADFDGRYYKLAGALHSPKPLQKPYPPIWIGGSGEQLTLRVVAEHADVWNAAGGSADQLQHKVRVLEEHCAAIGRDPAEIRRSVQVRFAGDPEATVAELQGYVDLGFTENVVIVTGPEPVAAAERVASDVLPHAR
jgi:F420-dependent oxidoreductase-like protein